MPARSTAAARPPVPTGSPKEKSSELIKDSRDHLRNAGVELALAAESFLEAWLILWEDKAEGTNAWLDLARRVAQEVNRFVEEIDRQGAGSRGGKGFLAHLIETLDRELEAIEPPMNEHKRAYRDALLGVKRVLAQSISDSAPLRKQPTGASFRKVEIE